MEKEIYFKLKNNSDDVMTIYRDEPSVIPLSEEWTRTLCRYFTWVPEFTSIQPHRYPKMAEFIDDYIRVGYTEQLRLKSCDLVEFVDKLVESFYKIANVYVIPLFSEPTMSLDYYPTLKFTTEYEPHRDFVGFAFATREEIYRWYNTKRITKFIEQDILRIVNRELAIYNEYLRGATFHYVINTVDGTELARGVDFCELNGDTDKMLELMLKDSSVYDQSFVEI